MSDLSVDLYDVLQKVLVLDDDDSLMDTSQPPAAGAKVFSLPATTSPITCIYCSADEPSWTVLVQQLYSECSIM